MNEEDFKVVGVKSKEEAHDIVIFSYAGVKVWKKPIRVLCSLGGATWKEIGRETLKFPRTNH